MDDLCKDLVKEFVVYDKPVYKLEYFSNKIKVEDDDVMYLETERKTGFFEITDQDINYYTNKPCNWVQNDLNVDLCRISQALVDKLKKSPMPFWFRPGEASAETFIVFSIKRIT